MVESMGGLKDGRNTICAANGKNSQMMMNIDVWSLARGTAATVGSLGGETAVLLVKGTVTTEWQNQKVRMERASEFNEDPWALHVPKDVQVRIVSEQEGSIVLVQSTENGRVFSPELYRPEDCRSEIFGEGEWGGTARRIVRTVFDYGNAPYSNMVLGEVITWPGKWSSYPPHWHPQPEVYYYRFDHPQGFGLCLNGNKAYKITDNSYAAISGGDVHPQTSAPGYAMYYAWMIRHLKDNPWRDRITAEDHKWLCGKNIRIWPDKEQGGMP
jgi:5-deoxy-glucuronate isomerase